jgi:hypothetical protein
MKRFIGSTFAIRQMKKMTTKKNIALNSLCWKVQRINLVQRTQIISGVAAHSEAFMLVVVRNLLSQYGK